MWRHLKDLWLCNILHTKTLGPTYAKTSNHWLDASHPGFPWLPSKIRPGAPQSGASAACLKAPQTKGEDLGVLSYPHCQDRSSCFGASGSMAFGCSKNGNYLPSSNFCPSPEAKGWNPDKGLLMIDLKGNPSCKHVKWCVSHNNAQPLNDKIPPCVLQEAAEKKIQEKHEETCRLALLTSIFL